MKARLPLIFFPFLFLQVNICSAQNEKLIFHRIPPPTGMHPGSKACVQDAQGYMWIGTYQQPLRRYDGYNYTFYANDPLDSNSLAQNWVEAICAGRNGYIWIGTWGNGLDRLDPATGRFIHYRFRPNDSNSMSNDFVRDIHEDREGIIWIATRNGLNRLDPKTGTFRHYYHSTNDPHSLSCNQVMTIYEDTTGTIWVGTGSFGHDEGGKTDEGGLNRFDKANDRFIRYLHKPTDTRSLINNKVRAIFEDSRGTFWVGTAGDGLHTMDRSNGTFVRHRYDPAHPERLSRPAQKQIRPYADDHITFIIEDSAGAVWIGTFGNGLNRYDPVTNKVTYYPLFKDAETGMQLEVPWWACNSRDGMLWIGYWKGIYRVDPLRKNIPYFATGTTVDAICEDKFGALWYGTDQGLVRKDRQTGMEQNFFNDPRNPNTISNNRIYAIHEDRKGELWIGTAKGLNRFDQRTDLFFRPRFHESVDTILSKVIIVDVYEDEQGFLWLGTEIGLVRINRQTNACETYRHDPKDSTTIAAGGVYCIYEDRSSNLWAATSGGTLNRLLPYTGKVQRFLKDVNIHDLCQDSEGIFWVGTSTGLYRSNSTLSGFSLFTGPNGEFSGNTIVNGVLEDDQKNLWVNASVGICRLNPQRNKLLIFSRQNDPAWANGTGSYKGTHDELFFGGSSGYFIVSPEEMKGNTIPPQIVLSAFRVADRPITPGRESPLKVPISIAKEIRLNHDQNVFSFDFAGIHFCNPEANRHLFMLEGLDNNWRKAGEEKTAYYYNVPPGHYTFHVKAANSDGEWAEKSISVIINPPWWRTWWAYTLYGLLFIAGLYAVHHYQHQRLVRKERERLRQVELAQAKEIEKAYTELKATQAQLVQREKMASLGELTAGIAHEIQNPLNFVNNFSDVNKELLIEMKEEMKRGNLDDANVIANDVIENEDKINHHGKRADAIVKGMLQHSRSSSGVKAPTDINDLADEYLRLAYHGLRAKDNSFNATMKTDFDESIGRINIVSQDIGRVLLNLYNNAFYAVTEKKKQQSEGYEPTVSVSTKKEKDKVEIKVKDNGSGIPQKILDKIFQPFFTTKPTGQGTGLGLSLSYDIVKAHGGDLQVETKEGERTEFIIRLPA